MNDLEASIGLEAIDVFWDTFWTRHKSMKRMRAACVGFEDVAWFSEEDEDNINCPHGFSITCKKERDIEFVKKTFDKYNIHHKRNFGCVPTQHKAFEDMGYKLGTFPESEWVGNNAIHIGCHQYFSEQDIERICTTLKEALGGLK
jgi:dTDP-4-amino-4,6-dideoxygalactose transaminase